MEEPKNKLTRKGIIKAILIHIGVYVAFSPFLYLLFNFLKWFVFGSYYSESLIVIGLENLFLVGVLSFPFVFGFFVNYWLTKKMKFNVILLAILLVLYHLSLITSLFRYY